MTGGETSDARRLADAYLDALEGGDLDEAGELFNELVHQGDLYEVGVEATPFLLAAAEREPALAGHLVHDLAWMCTCRPESRAARIRAAVRERADLLRRLLGDGEAAVRRGAVAALAVSGAADADDRARLALLAAGDAAPTVRGAAALALGLLGADEQAAALERVFEQDEEGVRWTAAWALARIGRISEPVLAALVRAVSEPDAALAVYGHVPLDNVVDDPREGPAPLGLPAAEPALPLLLDQLDRARDFAAHDVADVLLRLAIPGDRQTAKAPRSADRLSPLQREILDRLAASDDAWGRREELRALLRDHGLPQTRKELRAWLAR